MNIKITKNNLLTAQKRCSKRHSIQNGTADTERMDTMKIVHVYEDKYGSTRCGNCDEELLCDENGDMPQECPCCYSLLDYSFYDNK